MADQPPKDQQGEEQIGNNKASDILHRALQEAATECFESSSEPSNLERPTVNANVVISDDVKLTSPVGSSSNPIQIIQQGNTYHSTQSLSQEQLQQIAQVLQQQQLVQANQKGGTSVLYNPVTNTRVVYRVIYPAQLQAKTTNLLSGSEKTAGASRGRGRSRVKKGCGRRSPEEEEDEEKVEGSGPELSREEKEERKKHRPRTRCGRISKPPSYMVKDYKRIHHLDFDEEPYDDSDGGYSDFNVSADSENEEDINSEDSKSRRLPTGVTTARRRNFKCCTCEKAYIGRGGLTRHYRLNPGHVNPDGHESDDHSNATIHSADDSNLMAHSLDATSEPKTDTAVTSKSEDVNIQLSPSLVEAVPESLVAESEKVSIDQQYKRKEANYYQRKMDPVYRKTRLKGVISQCSDEELVEVVMPRLAKVVSAWEFLRMKCEREPNVDVARMYSELENVLKHAAKVAHGQLVKPGSQLCSEHLNVTDDRVAKALGLSVGTYGIKHSEPVEFCLRLPKPHPTETIATEMASVTEPSEKRRRIEDSAAQTFSILEDAGCESNYFLEPKDAAADSEPNDAVVAGEESNDANVNGGAQASPRQTDVVVIGEASDCVNVNGVQYFSLDPQTSRLFERKEETGDNFTTARLEKPTFTQLYSVQVETEEDRYRVSAVQGNVSSQEMTEDDQMDTAVNSSEAPAFSAVQEVEFACGADAEISRIHGKEENGKAAIDNDVQIEKHTFAQLCTMQVGNGNGHFLCDVPGIIFPANLSQEQAAGLAGETVEFACRKDSLQDLGLDRESCTIHKEGNVEVRNEEVSAAQLEVHTFEHDVCTLEVENEDCDILGDDACILPPNAVIVSSLPNSECEMTTYQIPDTEVPIETVQALLAMNDASAGNK